MAVTPASTPERKGGQMLLGRVILGAPTAIEKSSVFFVVAVRPLRSIDVTANGAGTDSSNDSRMMTFWEQAMTLFLPALQVLHQFIHAAI